MSFAKDDNNGRIPEYWIMNWEDFLAGKKFPQMKELGIEWSDSSSEESDSANSTSDSSVLNHESYDTSYNKKILKISSNYENIKCQRKVQSKRAPSLVDKSVSTDPLESTYIYDKQCTENVPTYLRSRRKRIGHSQNDSMSKKKKEDTLGKGGYLCNLCNQIFSAGYAMKKHIRVHTREKPFECDFCNKTFSQWGNLRLHIQRHLGIAPYKCIYCDKAYIAPSKLKVHVRSHTNERPFMCKTCFACFKSNDDLHKHTMTHANSKPFVCWVCDKSFIQPSKLKQHLKSKHTLNVNINKKDVTNEGDEYEIELLPNS